jgi:hypothetical protein
MTCSKTRVSEWVTRETQDVTVPQITRDFKLPKLKRVPFPVKALLHGIQINGEVGNLALAASDSKFPWRWI